MAGSGRPDPGDAVRAPAPTRRERGFILLTVILATLALTLLALAALALAMAEHRASEWDRRWIGTATGARPPGSFADPDRDSLVSALGFGFRVVTPRPMVGVPTAAPISMHRVGWCLDPAFEALGPWELEPGVPAPPALGPLGVTELGRLADALSEHPEPLPPGVLVSGAMVRVLPGSDRSLLVLAEGDLELHGSGAIHAVVIVGGRLRLGPDAYLVGGGRASAFELSTPGTFLPDPSVVEAALEALPVCPVLVHILGRLGRF
jgi:hypothetical protein